MHFKVLIICILSYLCSDLYISRLQLFALVSYFVKDVILLHCICLFFFLLYSIIFREAPCNLVLKCAIEIKLILLLSLLFQLS